MKTVCTVGVLWTLGAMAVDAGAEVFYGGHPKGFHGDEVNLTINARAGTFLEGIDITPDPTDVAGVLDFLSLDTTNALTDGGSGLCFGSSCSFFYLTGKTFTDDTVLATLRFRVEDAAPVGPVAFDPQVVVGVDSMPIPNGQGFEVLAVPEPGTWASFAAGIALIGALPWWRRYRSSNVGRALASRH
ncbi:MAG: hypothetical protein GC151_01800 [Betaproteobacteria bacterium]|nr:hypothetical protein [Betaproteobacteria bacterium]